MTETRESSPSQEPKPVEPTHAQVELPGLTKQYRLVMKLIWLGVVMVFLIGELFHSGESEPKPQEPAGPSRFSSFVCDQLVEMERVAPSELATTFASTLERYDCPWILQCRPHPVERDELEDALKRYRAFIQRGLGTPASPLSAAPPPRPLVHSQDSCSVAQPPPLPDIPIHSIPHSNWHQISGTPHALLVTARTIREAGAWAMVLFASATVLWISLLYVLVAKEKGIFALFLAFSTSTAIPYLVAVFQHVCFWLVHTFGVFGARVAHASVVTVAGTSLSTMVTVYHMRKTGQEFLEILKSLWKD